MNHGARCTPTAHFVKSTEVRVFELAMTEHMAAKPERSRSYLPVGCRISDLDAFLKELNVLEHPSCGRSM